MGDVTWFHISLAGFSINQDVINPMNIEKLRFNKFNAPKTTFVGNSFHSFLINSNKHIQQQASDNGIQINFQSFNNIPSILYNQQQPLDMFNGIHGYITMYHPMFIGCRTTSSIPFLIFPYQLLLWG